MDREEILERLENAKQDIDELYDAILSNYYVDKSIKQILFYMWSAMQDISNAQEEVKDL